MSIDLPVLWDFQAESVNRLRHNIRNGVQAQVLCLPTGAGKGEIAKYMIGSAAMRRNRAVLVVDRRFLLEQMSRRFNDAGIEHGLLTDRKRSHGLDRPIIITTVQALTRLGRWPTADVIFVDECHSMHTFLTDTLRKQDCPIIGMSATPVTRGMGKIYDTVVQTVTTDDLWHMKRLAPMRVRPCVEIDMAGTPLVHGEYPSAAVQQRGRRVIGNIVSDCVAEWGRVFGGPVPTMMFSASIAHGAELCRAFQAAGYDARQTTTHDDSEQTNALVQAFMNREFPVICSVDKLAKGVDLPFVKMLVLARPYVRAFAAHIQMLGRGLRTDEGKDFVAVNDHSGNYLGFYGQTMEYFAEGVTALDDRKYTKAKRNEKTDKTKVLCRECGIVLPPKVENCPSCGAARRRGRSEIENVPGTLISVSGTGKQFRIEPVRKGRAWTGTEAQLWTACCSAAMRGFMAHGNEARSVRQAKAHYHELSGEWPPREYTFMPGKHVPATIRRRLDQARRAWKKAQQTKQQETEHVAT